MAVAFDAFSENKRTGTTDPADHTHTPVGTPRGVIVLVSHGTDSTDWVSGVTYGGVALTRIVRATDTAGEPGATELWFLGSGIPAGAQTVSVDLTSATATDMYIGAVTVTADADTEVIDFDSINENSATVSLTLQYGGRTAQTFGALYSGQATPGTDYVEAAGNTRLGQMDHGAFFSLFTSQTTPGSSDFTLSGTVSGTDDVAFTALAVSEVSAGGVTVLPDVGVLTLTGFAVAVGLPVTVVTALGQLTLDGFAPTIITGPTVTPGVGVLDLTGFAPVIEIPVTVTLDIGSLVLTGFEPTIQSGPTVLPGVGALVFTGFEPTIGLPITVVPGVGALVLAGFAPSLGVPVSVAPGLGALVLTGFAPIVGLPVTVRPDVGVLTLDGFTPTVFTSSDGVGWLEFDLIVDTTTAGNFNLKWAQLISNPLPLTVKAGAYVEYIKIS